MTEKTSDKFQQSYAILNAYSIQEISSIFGDIDEKILSLHTCSSEDFLTLNAYFKKYYADSKNISENAKNLFDIITRLENKNTLFKQLDEFQKCLQDLFQLYEKYQDQIIGTFDKMVQGMEEMFVTASNLKQDLMTLKLLVANLKLDIIVSSASSEKMARKANDFNELIIQTKSFFVEFFKNSNDFKNLLKSTSSQLVQYRDRNVQNSNELLAEIKSSTSLLDQKYDEAIHFVPKLSESTQSTSSSIAKIITNLQYQDIIRQKIDHIQQAHKEILNELKDIKETDNEQSKLESRLKCYLQIRDIAGLQSSQLIHTNKEYQKAIEIITSKFLEVGRDMNQISELCHLITLGANNNKNSHFDEIREKFEKTSYLTELIQKSVQFSKEKITIANAQFSEIYNNYIELTDFIKTIDKSISRSLENQLATSDSNHFEPTIKQIRNILDGIQTINNQYQQQYEEINQLNYGISLNNETQALKISNLEMSLASFSERYVLLTNSLNTTNEKIYKIVTENHLLSSRISEDIKTSIGQIKYYDFFDKVIDEIINKLNEINIKLQNIEGTESDDSNINMEHMKQRYTMQSEHIIHDTLTEHHRIDLEQLDSTGIDEEDDNLELF
jgi:hypothetical protein